MSQAQNLTSSQEDIIHRLSVQSANLIANQMLLKITDIDGRIQIKVVAAKNSDKNVTTLGYFLSKFLTNNLQAKLDAVIIKRNRYELFFEDEKAGQAEFALEISYFIKGNSFTFSEITLNSDNKKYSLDGFSIEGEMSKLRDLSQVATNVNYEKILKIKNDSGLFQKLTIYNSDKEIIETKSENLQLKLNENYKFRFDLKKRTYLYVFYYEPTKSNFYTLYPTKAGHNKPVTYHLKDVQNIKFSDVQNAVLKVIVSAKKLNIDGILCKKTISSDEAETILKELIINEKQISAKNWRLAF